MKKRKSGEKEKYREKIAKKKKKYRKNKKVNYVPEVFRDPFGGCNSFKAKKGKFCEI